MKKPHLAFITDQYPPYFLGGAELSLKAVVDQLKDQYKVTVFVIGNQPTELQETAIDGVKIIQANLSPSIDYALYGSPDFPFHLFPSGFLTRITRWFGSKHVITQSFFMFSFYANYVLKKRTDSIRLRDRIRLVWVNMFSLLTKRIENIEYFDEDYGILTLRGKRLAALLSARQIDYIHADNYQSIMAYWESGVDIPAIGMIRDLRFFCGRRVLIAHTQAGPCHTCSWQCKKEIHPFIRKALIKILKKNIAFRHQVLTRYQHLLSPSHYLKNGLPSPISSQMSVIHDPVEKLPASPAQNKQVDRINLLFVGSLSTNKGPDILLEAYQQLKAQLPQLVLHFAGTGPLASDLAAQAAGIQDVQLLGALDRHALGDQFEWADIVICPNRWPEPFGRVPIEAMLHGCVVLATAAGGFLETIEDGVTGYLYQGKGSQDVAEALMKVIQNRAHWPTITDQAQQFALTFNEGETHKQYQAFYKDVFENSITLP